MHRSYPFERRNAPPSAFDAAAANEIAESFAYLSASEPRPPRTPPTSRIHSRYEDPTTPPSRATMPGGRYAHAAPRTAASREQMLNTPAPTRTPRRRRPRQGVAFVSPVAAQPTPRERRYDLDAEEDDDENEEEQAEDADAELEDKPLTPAAAMRLDEDAGTEPRVSQLERQFFAACQRGNARAVQRILEESPALVYATTHRLNTPLHIAAEYKHGHVAQVLLDCGANVDEVNQDGQTPLHLAAAVGSRALIRILGNAGARIDARSKRNYTPLHMATSRGYVSAAMRLIDLGADVDAAAKGGIRPLHIAAFARDDVLVTHLLDRGASIEAMDDKRLDALNYAMMSQSATVFHVIYSRILDKFKTLQQENEKLQRKAHEAKAQVHLIQDSKWLSKIPPLYTVLRLPSRRKSVLKLSGRKDRLVLLVHSQISGVCYHEPLEMEISRDKWQELREVTIGGLYFLASLSPDMANIVARGILMSCEQAIRRRMGKEEHVQHLLAAVQAPIEECLRGSYSQAQTDVPATHPYQLKKLLATFDKDFHWTKIPMMVGIKCAYHKKWRRLVWASDDEIHTEQLELFYHPPSGGTHAFHSRLGPPAARPSSAGSGSHHSSSFNGDEEYDEGSATDNTSQRARNPLMSISLRLLNVHCRQASDYNAAFCEWRLENRGNSMVYDAGRFRMRSLLQQLPVVAGGPPPGSEAGGVLHVDPLKWSELRDCRLVLRVLRGNSAVVNAELVKEFVIDAKYELEFDSSSSYRCSFMKRLSCDAMVATVVLEGKRLHYAGRRRAPSG